MSPDPEAETPTERWLGPYRVLRPLGRGGMGEVVLAVDPRLERRVAIKRLLIDTGAGENPSRAARRRARFRREARMLAKLRHPAIVQVFELLWAEGEDHLVMEHVDGPNLREVLETEGPLPAEEVVGLARRLAEGLDHAHRHGIIHRDLKTENVLIDGEGEPRLADFGLARSDRRLAPAEDNVTAEGQLVGTFRAMAPEQILGEPAGVSTDLHALGVLIFETLTGRSPFEAPTRQATLARVLTHTPHLEGADAPAELVELVTQLLEKDPARRPQNAGEVVARLARIAAGSDPTETFPMPSRPSSSMSTSAPPMSALRKVLRSPQRLGVALAALSLLAGAAWLVSRGWRSPAPLHVAVLETVVGGAPAEEADMIAFAVRSAAQRALSGLESVVALGAAEVDGVASGRTPREVALATASDQVLVSEARCDAAECWLELSRVDGETARAVWSTSIQTPRAEPSTLAWATEVAVAGGLATRRRAGQRPMPPELLAEMLPLHLVSGREASIRDPRATFEKLEQLHLRFGAHADLDAWRAIVASQAFLRSREPSWIERSFEALEDARASDPTEPKIQLVRADLEMITGRLEAAEQTLKELERQRPSDVRVEEMLAQLALAQGDSVRALERMQAVATRRPSWLRLYNLAAMASRAGRIDLALSALDQLELRAPRNLFGLRLRASLELSHGDLERAVAIYTELAARSPDAAVWSNLGVAHLLRRDARAALSALEHARGLRPDDPLVLLNLADAHALAGSAEARSLYLQVVAGLEKAPETDLQALTTRAQALAHLGNTAGAVADVEAAIRRGSENPAVRSEAAIVYALVGDLASARRNRQRALELGVEPRWFSLPTFDNVGLTDPPTEGSAVDPR